MYRNIHGTIDCKKKKDITTYPVIMKLDKSNGVYPTNGILHSSENESFTATYIKMDESRMNLVDES